MACSSRARARVVPILLLPLLAVAACDDKKTPANLREYVSQLAALVCKFNVACEGTPDMASCLATTLPLEDPELAVLEADIASGKSKYDAAKANACLEWFESYTSAGCTQSARAAVLAGEDACAPFLVGTVAPGGACIASTACADSGLCQPTEPTCAQQCCPGTCLAPAAPIPVGGDCSTPQPNQSCATGSFCLRATSGAPLTCVVPGMTAEGGACSGDYQCTSPFFCDMDAATGMGTCRRLAASGAACNSSAPAYVGCDDIRDACDATTGKCVRRTAVGESCDPARSMCVGYALCTGNICVAYPKPGAACTPGGSPDCLGSLECSAQTSTCELPPSDGSCT